MSESPDPQAKRPELEGPTHDPKRAPVRDEEEDPLAQLAAAMEQVARLADSSTDNPREHDFEGETEGETQAEADAKTRVEVETEGESKAETQAETQVKIDPTTEIEAGRVHDTTEPRRRTDLGIPRIEATTARNDTLDRSEGAPRRTEIGVPRMETTTSRKQGSGKRTDPGMPRIEASSARPDSGKTEVARIDLAKTEAPKTEPPKTEPPKAEAPKIEPAVPKIEIEIETRPRVDPRVTAELRPTPPLAPPAPAAVPRSGLAIAAIVVAGISLALTGSLLAGSHGADLAKQKERIAGLEQTVSTLQQEKTELQNRVSKLQALPADVAALGSTTEQLKASTDTRIGALRDEVGQHEVRMSWARSRTTSCPEGSVVTGLQEAPRNGAGPQPKHGLRPVCRQLEIAHVPGKAPGDDDRSTAQLRAEKRSARSARSAR